MVLNLIWMTTNVHWLVYQIFVSSRDRYLNFLQYFVLFSNHFYHTLQKWLFILSWLFISKQYFTTQGRVHTEHFRVHASCIGGSKGVPGTHAPSGSNFFHFHTVFGKIGQKIIGCSPPPLHLALLNPEAATVMDQIFCNFAGYSWEILAKLRLGNHSPCVGCHGSSPDFSIFWFYIPLKSLCVASLFSFCPCNNYFSCFLCCLESSKESKASNGDLSDVRITHNMQQTVWCMCLTCVEALLSIKPCSHLQMSTSNLSLTLKMGRIHAYP